MIIEYKFEWGRTNCMQRAGRVWSFNQRLPVNFKIVFPLTSPQIIIPQSCRSMSSWLNPFDRGENRGPERRDHKGIILEAKGNQPQLLSHIWKDTPRVSLSVQISYPPSTALGLETMYHASNGRVRVFLLAVSLLPPGPSIGETVYRALQGGGYGQAYERLPRILPNTVPKRGQPTEAARKGCVGKEGVRGNLLRGLVMPPPGRQNVANACPAPLKLQGWDTSDFILCKWKWRVNRINKSSPLLSHVSWLHSCILPCADRLREDRRTKYPSFRSWWSGLGSQRVYGHELTLRFPSEFSALKHSQGSQFRSLKRSKGAKARRAFTRSLICAWVSKNEQTGMGCMIPSEARATGSKESSWKWDIRHCLTRAKRLNWETEKDTRGSAKFRSHSPWMPWERSWSVHLVSRENNINGSHLVLRHLAEMERNTSEMGNQRSGWHQALIWNLRPLQSSWGQVLSVLQ